MSNKKRRSSKELSEKLSVDRKVGGHFKIVGKRIGTGNFGEVRMGIDTRTNTRVAIKLERTTGNNSKNPINDISLKHETEVLKRIHCTGSAKGFPELLYFGKCASIHCLVMELLGPNLEDLMQFCGRKFSLKTSIMIAFQVLDRIEFLHSKGILYRDIKPENFLLGLPNSENFNRIYLVDFGLAVPYLDLQGHHLPFEDCKIMTGTARYMSVNSHMGKSQSRRDDLESISYMLLYFIRGSLPWQGIICPSLKDKYRRIKNCKMTQSVEQLCRDVPEEFQHCLSYAKSLAFTETPDYEYLKDLFHRCYERHNFSYDDPTFDWTGKHLPQNLFKVVQTNRLEGIAERSISSQDTEASVEISDGSPSNSSMLPSNNKGVKSDEEEFETIKSTTAGISYYGEEKSLRRQTNTTASKVRGSQSEVELHRELEKTSMKKSSSNSGVPSSSNFSQGYYSNSDTSGATGPAGGAVRKKPVPRERNPADRLLNLDAIEKLASRESDRLPDADSDRRKTKKNSLLCFKWRNKK